nr:retrovirus-related Pol polyprotein from transposon TNT 1-94 [Tanacetum cinerariifolium]
MDHQYPTIAKIPEVIEFDDSYVVPANTTDTTGGDNSGRTLTLTAEDMQRKKNDTFGGNEATKKTKKNLLKQQYGNFKAEVWRNRSDLDTMSLDDLYNHLKVYESEVQKKPEQNSQNMAFISSVKHNSRNEDGNTASVPIASTNGPTTSASVATISQDIACAYIAFQSSGPQIKFKDINQIDEDDIEEMDIKWNMALLSMRADKFWKKTGKKISIQGSAVVGFDKSKVECFNCHKMGHFARECRAPRSQDRGRRDNLRQGSKAEEQAPKALMAIDGKNNDSLNSKITDLTDKLFNANNFIYHYKLALAQVESRLVEYKEREVKYIEKIRTLEYYNESYKECIDSLKKKLETLQQEKEGVNGKVAGLLTALKDLDNLIESQWSKKNKERLRYTNVPPPTAQLYLSPKKDLSWIGLPECDDDTVTDYSRPSSTIESISEDDQNINPSETVASPIPSKPFIKFVKPKDSQSDSKTDKKETPKKLPVKKRVKKNFTPRPAAYKPYRPSQIPVKTHMNDARPNRTFFNKQAHSYTNKPVHITSAVRSPSRAPWVPTVNRNYSPVNRKFSTGSRNFPTANRKFPTASRKFSTGSTKECIVLGRDFKLLDDANILLRTPRHNLVRGLPTKYFENDHTCTACLKGKQHNASCKSKLVNSVTKPLHTLYMDLFGPNSISSISHKWYCLVVTDDFSRFTWTFFLKSKDETSGILKKFITEIENLKDLKVKIIRCDNGGEFRNKEMNDFCLQKGIKREFSNASTPQQNGVAERRNRTLIEAARTMLADAKLLVTFWTEALNTACYVQNMVLVNKSHNKTPYELFNGRSPAIGFLKPFGCHVMILNTLDNLGNFEKKGDEGYFIGYSMTSKAFRLRNPVKEILRNST